MHTSVALLLELGLILTALSVLGALARRFALTPVPLYLLTGLALGEAASHRCGLPVSSSRSPARSASCSCY